MRKHAAMILAISTPEKKPESYVFDWHETYEENRKQAVIFLRMLYENTKNGKHLPDGASPVDGTLCRFYDDAKEGDVLCTLAWKDGTRTDYRLSCPSYVGGGEPVPEEASGSVSGKQGILRLSTLHITPDASELLMNELEADSIQIYPHTGGCLIHVNSPDEVLESDLPDCIRECIRFAGSHNCRWIQFSPDGSVQSQLRTYRKLWDMV